ncbi:MAG: class I mannose-6-phosphate isomerase [Victivallales bacterium]|nr:class I mannose-6-phosphate isomerase [Victivallales bacterium]
MAQITDSKLYPMYFKPIYKRIMWGGDLMTRHLGRRLPSGRDPIAESWELCDREGDESVIANGEMKGRTISSLLKDNGRQVVGNSFAKGSRFPLLVKIIDAGKRLSLQVHPDEEACRQLPGAEPKTEMWYVLAAEPHAKIFAGLGRHCTMRRFIDSIGSDAVEACLQTFQSVPGDAYFINSGRVHAIDGGNLILEVQQNSNTTYRISDWGREDDNGKSRELHVDKALSCIHFGDRSSPRVPGVSGKAAYNRRFPLVNRCQFFNVDSLVLVEDWSDSTDGTSFHLLAAADHPVSIEGHDGKRTSLPPGRTCLVPAAYGKYSIRLEGKEATVVKTTL